MFARIAKLSSYRLACALCAGAIAGIQSAASAPLTYSGFVERARVIHAGETRAQIVAALGTPSAEGKAFLDYSLTKLSGFPGLPGPVGTQVFPGMRVELHNGRMVGAIEWDWMDTTGPAPAAPKVHPARS